MFGWLNVCFVFVLLMVDFDFVVAMADGVLFFCRSSSYMTDDYFFLPGVVWESKSVSRLGIARVPTAARVYNFLYTSFRILASHPWSRTTYSSTVLLLLALVAFRSPVYFPAKATKLAQISVAPQCEQDDVPLLYRVISTHNSRRGVIWC